jgi:hypothetical protein
MAVSTRICLIYNPLTAVCAGIPEDLHSVEQRHGYSPEPAAPHKMIDTNSLLAPGWRPEHRNVQTNGVRGTAFEGSSSH